MSRDAWSSRRSGVALRSSLVVAVACLAVGISTGAVAGEPGTAVTFGSATSAALVPAPLASFSERTGYSSVPLTEISGSVPAAGAESLVVTFEPSSSLLYDPPAPGAAPMSVDQVAAAYGLSGPAYASAEAYFESEGLAVAHSWPDRLSLSLTGSVAAVDRAFSTSIRSGVFDGGRVTFTGTPPSLPTGLESEVASVAGLESGFDRFSLPEVAQPLASVGSSRPTQNPTDLVTPSIARGLYGVSGLYNLTPSPTYAVGKGIVLLLWGAGYAPNDVQTFFSQDYPAGFPTPNVVAYPVDGAPSPSPNAPNDPSNGSREMTLDLEWSGSMAPGATLDAVYAPAGPASAGYSPTDASMIDALNLAVDSTAIPSVAAISMSFGSADGGDATLTTGFETDFSVAAKEQISLFAATGDLGGDASTGCAGGPQPDYPSASPQVAGVGGTDVSLDRGVLGAINGFTESAWSDSGGGFSAQFGAPSWQEVGSAAAPIKANGHRGMPDVAATAAYNFLYFDGGPAAGGGTSFATPLWAGIVTEMDALRGTNMGFLTPALYGLGANISTQHPSYNDVTTGGNCLGAAGAGWDTATGWGSPVALDLYVHLVGSFVNISLSPAPSTVAPGGSVMIEVTVTNATSGSPIAATPILVSLAGTGLGGPCSGSFGSVTPISNASGSVVATLSVPGCYLGSSAAVSVSVDSDGHYGEASGSIHVNLLGFVPGLLVLSEYPYNVVLFVVIMAVAIAIGGFLGRRRRPTDPGADAAAPVAALPSPSTAPSAPEPPREEPPPSEPAPAEPPVPSAGS